MSPSDLRERFFRLPWLRVKNGTGSTIPPCSVILASTATADNNNTLITAIQPNSGSTDFNRGGYYITGPFAIGSGSTQEGLCVAATEPWYARYGDGTPARGTIYGPKHSQLTLAKNYFGFECQGHNTTVAGNNVTLVRWIGVDSVLGKVDDTNLNKGSSCTVSVQAGDPGSETDTSMNITGVYNRAINMTSINGKWCRVSWSGNTPLLDWVECS